MATPQKLVGHTIFVLEGPTDASFIARLSWRLWHPGVKFDPKQFDTSGHQTLVTGGKENLSSFLAVLPKIPGFNQVKRIIIMQDADDSFSGTLTSICTLSDNYLQTSFGAVPEENVVSTDASGRQVIPWVAPFQDEQGDLEKVLWQAVPKSSHTDCVESFLACLETSDAPLLGSRWKALVGSYLITMSNPTYQPSHWYQQSQFPWDDPVFDVIKARLQHLRDTDPE